MIKKLSFLVIFSLFSITAISSEGPDDFLKKSVQEVSDLVSIHKERFENDEIFLRKMMNDVVMPKLDINLMSKIILGKKTWTKMTSAEKIDFMNAFKYKMTSTYMKSVTAFDGDDIEFFPYTPGKRKNLALVKSKYIIAAGDIEVDYRLIKQEEGWRIYDIIFDGISLMKNYRADYREHVSKKGIRSLIDNLNR